MSWEIYTQANRNDQGVASDDIYSQAPEVHKPSNLYNGSEDAEDNKAGTPEAPEEDDDGDENCNHGWSNVLVQFSLDYLVCHPICIPESTFVQWCQVWSNLLKKKIFNKTVFLKTKEEKDCLAKQDYKS